MQNSYFSDSPAHEHSHDSMENYAQIKLFWKKTSACVEAAMLGQFILFGQINSSLQKF